jgi:hypothetical protein
VSTPGGSIRIGLVSKGAQSLPLHDWIRQTKMLLPALGKRRIKAPELVSGAGSI